MIIALMAVMYSCNIFIDC